MFQFFQNSKIYKCLPWEHLKIVESGPIFQEKKIPKNG